MRSMFNSAPFARFDLGAATFGGATQCPLGEIPMLQNGRVVCVRATAPSGMFAEATSKGVAYGAVMGQMEDPYLTQAERDKLLADIRAAQAQVKAIDDLMVWGGENDPGLKKYLGPDSTRFSALTNSIAPLYPTVRDLVERLAQTDGEYWYRPSADELAKVKQWVTGVNEMTKLIEKAKLRTYTPAPGTKPPPAMTTTRPVGTGATSGITTENVLVGGAVALGLGLLIAAIT